MQSPASEQTADVFETTAIDVAYCARCQATQVYQHLRESHLQTSSKGISVVLPEPVMEHCPLCNLFKELRKCEVEDEINSVPKNSKQGLRVPSIHRDLHVRLHTEYRRGWNMPYFAFLSLCPYCSKVHEERLLPLDAPQACETTSRRGTGHVVDQSSADLHRVREWMRNCDLHHDSPTSGCLSSSIRRPRTTPLRIIDCRSRVVRQLEFDEPYICLSYVWGNITASEESLGVGAQLPEDTPKTIEDAIFVADSLDIPQLWVDQYCINQHDVLMRAATIQSMDLIYGGAALTIVAASGINASSGLPGVRGTIRNKQQLLKLGHGQFVTSPDMREQVHASRWNTRGWTYQEAVLSPRTLVFTDSHLYFQCRLGYHHEDLSHGFREQRGITDATFRVFARSTFGGDPDAVYVRLNEYLPRKLTYDSDSLAAFEGVLNAFDHRSFSDSHAKHFYGIPIFYNDPDFWRSGTSGSPTHAFLNGLAWSLEVPTSRINGASTSELQELAFPSWAWASHKKTCSSATNRLVLKYCLRTNLAIHDTTRVEVIHSTIGAMGLNLLSTLESISADRRSFQPCVDVATLVMRLKGHPETTSMESLDGERSFGGDVLLDNTNLEEHRDYLALYLGKSVLHEPAKPNTGMVEKPYWERLVFLLVSSGIAKSTYRRVGLWHFDYMIEDENAFDDGDNYDDTYSDVYDDEYDYEGTVEDVSYRVSLDKKPLRLMKREAKRSGFAECLGRRTIRIE